VKPPLYVSQHRHDVAPTASTFGPSRVSTHAVTNLSGVNGGEQPHRKSAATFGVIATEKPDPFYYLSKQTREPLPDPGKFSYADKRKPPIPQGQTPVPKTKDKGRQSNYIKQNALNIIHSKRSSGDLSDTAAESNGRFAAPNYGKVPTYLEVVKRQLDDEKSAKEWKQTRSSNDSLNVLDDESRREILDNLMKKRNDVMRQYQMLTQYTTIDSISKRKKKEELEKQLESLDKSVDKMSKSTVYIAT